tara:strand:- start:110 stop:313 length:204 start_codon:yes stop_codon:yes gene_type:complete
MDNISELSLGVVSDTNSGDLAGVIVGNPLVGFGVFSGNSEAPGLLHSSKVHVFHLHEGSSRRKKFGS